MNPSSDRIVSELARLLGPEQAAEAVRLRNLPPEAAEELLGDRRLSGETLTFLFRLPGWSTSYPVKAAMALHPRCPLSLMRMLINSLYLADLVRVISSRDIPRAGVRMAADHLRNRLPQIELGRKRQLARTGSRPVIEQLLHDGDLNLRALVLDSPRLTETDLVNLLRRPGCNEETIRLIAGSSRWNRRYRLVLEMCRHPATPPAISRELGGTLLRQDLEALVSDRDVSADTRNELYAALREKIASLGLKEKVDLIRTAPSWHTVNILIGENREETLLALVNAGVLKPSQLLAIVNDPDAPLPVLERIAGLNETTDQPALREALRNHPALSSAREEGPRGKGRSEKSR